VKITASGKPASINEAEFSGNLLLDGHGATIDGDLEVAGDFISLQNFTITGNLKIDKKLEHDFYSNNVNVRGFVQVNGGDTNTVVFENATLNQLDVNKPNVRVESLGDTSIQSIEVTTNATIIASTQSSINHVILKDEASNVDLQASVGALTLSTKKVLHLIGSGNINQLIVDSVAPVFLERAGEIKTLSVTQPQANLTVGSNTKVQNLAMPAGTQASQVIQNYTAVQSQISQINGTTNTVVPSGPTNRPPTQANPISNTTVILDDGPVVIDISTVFRDADNDPLTITAISRAPGIAAVQLTDDQLMVTPIAAGTAVIQMSATDGRQSASSRFSIIVNRKPVGIEISDQIITLGAEDKTLDLSAIFRDPDSDVLTFTSTTGSSSAVNATISGKDLILSAESAGTADVTVSANDGRGGTVSKTLHVLVNRAPEISNVIDDQTGTAGADDVMLDLTNVFQDQDGDTLSYEVESDDNAIATVALQGNFVKVTPVSSGTTSIKATAKDGKGASITESFNIKVNQSPDAAVITDRIITLGAESETVDLSSIFTDADGDSLAFTAVSEDTAIASVEISGNVLSIHPVAAGMTTITLTADDRKGGKTVRTFKVRINRAPTAANIDDQIISLGSVDKVLDLHTHFSDPDGDDLLLSAVVSDPSIATVQVEDEQLILKPGALGRTTVTVTASDSKGGTVARTFTITVRPNQAPIIEQAISDKSLSPGVQSAVNVAAVFSDPDQDTVTYTAISSDSAVATATIAGSELTISGVSDGEATITVTATDITGKSTSTTFNIKVSSNEAPVVVSSIPEQVIGLGVPANKFSIDQLFTDADSDLLTYTVTAADSNIVNPTINGNVLTLAPGTGHGRTTVTVTANDGKGGEVSSTIDVNTVQVMNIKQITTKFGVADVSYDLASYFSTDNALNVYRQEKGALTKDGKQPLNGRMFKTIPGTVGTTTSYWIVGNDGTAAFIELTVQEQQGAGVFFAEYTRGPEGRIALEFYNKSESTINYKVVGYRFNMTTQQMEVMKNREITADPYTNVYQVYPGSLGIIINHTFYDLMDITPVQWYHGEFDMTGNGNTQYVVCAFELIKDGQVVDVIGDKNWRPGSDATILPIEGTMIRKKGISTGSTTFNLSGEFDLLPLTYSNLFSHTP
ncbi:Ig-like domain-containing protein, partial [Lysinibacillus fusiformis]|nr:Ig-like domain-containing protein [Lysinibacillus fusiformis]